jgi:hypothetical protein
MNLKNRIKINPFLIFLKLDLPLKKISFIKFNNKFIY